jgi:hypothetical protein
LIPRTPVDRRDVEKWTLFNPDLLQIRIQISKKLIAKAGPDSSGEFQVCRRFAISSTVCGYKWLRAFRKQGEAGLQEKSRRPRSHPEQTSQQMEQRVLQLRARHPAWGGRKFRRRLQNLGVQGVPAASTITAILRRQ